MNKLIEKLSSRVADSSHYCLLRSESFRTSSKSRRCGGVPVYVGEEMERFVVSADLLNHPIFIRLLNKSAQEYGYQQKGVLRIPCHVLVFHRVLQALRFGGGDDDDASSRDLHALLNSFSPDDFL